MRVRDAGVSDFAETCRKQARAVAASDTGGDEIMRFVIEVAKLPEWSAKKP